jgi:glycosyltransferase involved in cell wall biosynthesis
VVTADHQTSSAADAERRNGGKRPGARHPGGADLPRLGSLLDSPAVEPGSIEWRRQRSRMITIVIPAYNEERGLGGVLDEARTVLAGSAALAGSEIIVVDDGSSDATAERARAGGADIVIRQPHNLGYGRALKAGIAAATHDVIVITDGDGSYPLDGIPRLVAKLDDGYDMVVGARTGASYRESAVKRPLRAILKFLAEFTTGRRVPDVNSGLRVFRKSTITSYFDHLSNSFSFTTSVTLAYMLTGRFVEYVPIEYRARVGSTNVRLVRDSLRTLQYIVQVITVYNPIKIFLLLSLASVVVALVSFALNLASLAPNGGVLGVLGLYVALVLFGLGLIADLLAGRRLRLER